MKLNFRKVGEGKPVVILHGLFGSSDNWQTFGKQLAGSGYAVYMVDLRNHGLSPHDVALNYSVLAEDVHELFLSEHLQAAVLIGHSLGGKTAMTFSFQHPESVKGLVVVDIAPRQYPIQHRYVLDALLSVDLNTVKSRQEVEAQLSKHLNETSVIQFMMKNLYWKEKDRLNWRFNLEAINSQIESVGKATKPENHFSKPTLFIKGEKSDYITYDDEREIFELFENVEVKSAPGAGHWVHAENPSFLLEVVRTFILKIG
jgi:esterase